MVLKKRGKYRHGDSQADIRDGLLRYSKKTGYFAHHFADAVCKGGEKLFGLAPDDDQGAAVRVCVACKTEHPIGDSDEYLEEAELGECACPCGAKRLRLPLVFRCPKCGLAAVYGDWKNEFNGYQKLLARV